MRNLFILTLLVAIVFAGTYANAESMSQAGPGHPLDVADTPMHTFISSSTINLTDTPQQIGTMPAGSTQVYVVASGALFYGSSDIKKGPRGGISLATGSVKIFNLRRDDVTPQIYLVNQASGTLGVTTAIMYWVK